MSNTIIHTDIHTDITDKLSNFICESKIPNIIFHGPSGGGKRTIVHKFITIWYLYYYCCLYCFQCLGLLFLSLK